MLVCVRDRSRERESEVGEKEMILFFMSVIGELEYYNHCTHASELVFNLDQIEYEQSCSLREYTIDFQLILRFW